MNFYKISSSDTKALFEKIGCDKAGAAIMSKKADTHLLYIKQMHVGAANILKQDALSIGADLAVPSGTILALEKYVDAVLIGTSKQFEILSKKELSQPFGLKDLAKELKSFTKTPNRHVQIMGVINANDDSFFHQSRFLGSSAVEKIEQMINDGAEIIDIGGVSSRPESKAVDPKEELQRVKPIIDQINEKELFKKAKFSIDSYEPLVIEYALQNGFEIVNDITGLQNDEVAKITAKYNATIIIMHMQGTPQHMQDNPMYDDIMVDIDNFFKQRIEKAKEFGIKNIILDVGIGFGKTLEHNLTLLKNLEHFKHFGYEILLAASRKSLIDKIIPCEVQERLPGTLAIHLDGIKKGASIIRCHDVYEHNQAIKIQETIESLQ